MTTEQVKSIVASGAFPGQKTPAEWVETHISWVILSPEYAFKIKKPVMLGFVDFSTPELRKFYCQEELRLNRRLAPDLYLAVLPIGGTGARPVIGATGTPALDHALQMRRMDSRRQMDILLNEGQVTPRHMEDLAAILSVFHRGAVLREVPGYHPAAHWADFAELYRYGKDLEDRLGSSAPLVLQQWRSRLPEFLEQHSERFQERIRQGFWVDGHGDLHARNIFLPTGSLPVVFDCLEFSAYFRHSDILNELAFLCMDLEARGRPDLSTHFLKAYRQHWEVFPAPEDHTIFRFFKAYRANVRLKVALIELRQRETAKLNRQVERYWALLNEYLD